VFVHAKGLRHDGVGPYNIFFDEKLEPHLDRFFEQCLGKQTAAPELDHDVWSFGMTVRRLRSDDATDRFPPTDQSEEPLEKCMCEFKTFMMIKVMEWLEDAAALIPSWTWELGANTRNGSNRSGLDPMHCPTEGRLWIWRRLRDSTRTLSGFSTNPLEGQCG
jgi:hypothetical protein